MPQVAKADKFTGQTSILLGHVCFVQISDISVLIMDDVLHKLHCLNYEREYCEMKDVQPFHRVYFALPSPHSG